MQNFRKGDRVVQAQFGPGVVLDVNPQYTDVAFDGGGVRRFVTTLVRLERSTRPLPPRPVPAPRGRKPRRRPGVSGR
jgi:hypothetical protein